MKRLERPVLFVCSCLAVLALVSCADKETPSSPPDPAEPEGPADVDPPDFTRNGVPILPYPAPLVSPDFASADSLVRYARGFVEGQYNRLRLLTGTVHSSLGVFNTGTYSLLDISCRIREYGASSDSSCGFTITICETASSFTWRTSATGTCGVGGSDVFGRDVTTGTTDEDASTGTFESYSVEYGNVEKSWRWDLAPDRREGTWTFYQGTALPANERGRLHWNGTDETRLASEFQWTDGERWTSEIAPDGTSGRMTLETRADGSLAWVPREEVAWAPAHGTWTVYAPDGEAHEQSW
ncbi:MAG: hypothetical protein R3E97_17190 [Candidatus Eisenbacteria bacterium]